MRQCGGHICHISTRRRGVCRRKCGNTFDTTITTIMLTRTRYACDHCFEDAMARSRDGRARLRQTRARIFLLCNDVRLVDVETFPCGRTLIRSGTSDPSDTTLGLGMVDR